MFARVTTLMGSDADVDIDAELRSAQATILPWLRDQTGYRGFVAMTDRAAHKTITITFWADAEAVRAGDQFAARSGDAFAKAASLELRSIETYEVLALESGRLEDVG
jgi:heme-degrading monooxygenase HmoA